MKTEDTSRLTEAFAQLTRYGVGPENEEILDALDLLIEVNDDIAHMRSAGLMRAWVDAAKTLLSLLADQHGFYNP